MKFTCSAIFFVLTTFTTSASATEQECVSTQADFDQCVAVELKAEWVKLNQKYLELRNAFYPSPRHQLIESQNNWIKYKDAACQLVVETGNGKTNLSACLLEKTKQRNAELAAFSQ